MEALENFWAQYGDIIISIVSSGSFGAIIVAIVNSVVKGATRKINSSTSVNFTDEQINGIAQKFAAAVSQKVFKVDISKLLTDEVSKQLSGLTDEITKVVEETEMSYAAMAIMAKGMSRSKILDEDERETLAKMSDELSAKAHVKESIEVTLEPETITEVKENDSYIAVR